MLVAPDIDPVAFRIGPLQVHWYGLMYLIGFITAWWLGKARAAKPGSDWNRGEMPDLIFYGAIGVILGGRIGYILFYNLAYYLEHPVEVFYIWSGGMSFHGGMLGVLFAMWLYARKTRRAFLAVTDFLAPLVPIGLGVGRLGNFINNELWGRVTDAPWGMVFRGSGGVPRHPSQLYEFGLEGVTLFLILWFYSTKPRPTAAVSAMFLLWYGTFRYLVEFAREPDAHIGFLVLGWITMGQVLSLPMIVAGAWMLWWAKKWRQKRIS